MRPRLAYGRHRGPVALGVRQAAVLVCIMPRASGNLDDQHTGIHFDDRARCNPLIGDLSNWQVPLIRRPSTMRHHGGQMAFPGGRIEFGETSRQAAVREFTEELGVAPTIRLWLADLPTHHVFASGHRVTAHVALIDPITQFEPHKGEVDQVHVIGADQIGDERFHRMTHERRVHSDDESLGWSFRTPAIVIGEARIWGMTAMILHDLARLLLHPDATPGE